MHFLNISVLVSSGNNTINGLLIRFKPSNIVTDVNQCDAAANAPRNSDTDLILYNNNLVRQNRCVFTTHSDLGSGEESPLRTTGYQFAFVANDPYIGNSVLVLLEGPLVSGQIFEILALEVASSPITLPNGPEVPFNITI